jgi:hypothetical protein
VLFCIYGIDQHQCNLNRARSVDKLVPFILERVTSVGVSFKFSKLSAIAGVVYVQKYYMRGEGTFGA